MNIIVTSGGTREPIDSVRSITNHASGRLGAIIADAFAAQEQVDYVVYVCGSRSVMPKSPKVETVNIEGTHDLERVLRELTAKETFGAIIHSMAVSDYRVRRVTTVSAMAEAAIHAEQTQDGVASAMIEADYLASKGKISSKVEDLAILLERTPKIIGLLRGLAPDAVIVGFKLLDGVSHEKLMETAQKLLEKNDCDFVLANDMDTVKSPVHCGFLLDDQGSETLFEGKESIAKGIVDAVMQKAAVT